MRYKFIISDSTDVYRNQAIEKTLFNYCDPETAIIYFWQNDNTIIVGKNQNIFDECKVEVFLKENGKLARRLSGGGAVYHDLGNLNISLIHSSGAAENNCLRELITGAADSIGVSAAFNGRNDILVNGKKVSGFAGYSDGEIVCSHCTLLFSSDIERMERYLTPEKSKLKRNRVSSVSARVANLSELYPNVDREHFISAVIGYKGALGLGEKPDITTLDKTEAFFRSVEWIYGEKK